MAVVIPPDPDSSFKYQPRRFDQHGGIRRNRFGQPDIATDNGPCPDDRVTAKDRRPE